jgi:hypothetical protein
MQSIEEVVNVGNGNENFKKDDHQIAISQDGKFAATFDTGKNNFVI